MVPPKISIIMTVLFFLLKVYALLEYLDRTLLFIHLRPNELEVSLSYNTNTHTHTHALAILLALVIVCLI